MVDNFSINNLVENGLDKRLGDFKMRVDRSTKKEMPLILFGAGVVGISYLELIRELSTVKVIFCDNNPQKSGMLIEGVPIISFDELKNNYNICDIIIASTVYYNEIFNQLTRYNLNKNVIGGIDVSLVKHGYRDYYNLIRENQDNFNEVYNLLSDEYSKRIFVDRLNYCISSDDKFLIPLISKTPQYFAPEIITFSKDEVFIDGGAYTGDTVEEFLIQTGGIFNKIYAFEPEQTKHKSFLQKYSDSKNIELVPYGLWSKKDVLWFNSQDSGSSQLSEFGDLEISVISIDEFLNGAAATFIKMDIEGAELEALKGAKKTIQKFCPKLAISIYHKPLDIVEIVYYIKELVPAYKFYLRHYKYGHIDTVLYAVA